MAVFADEWMPQEISHADTTIYNSLAAASVSYIHVVVSVFFH